MKIKTLCQLLGQLLLLSAIALLGGATTSAAVTILSGPSFTKATNAPLAGTLQLTTDVPSRVSVSVSNAMETWSRDFYDYSTVHSVPLFGFKLGRTNQITVTVCDQFRNASTAAAPLQFTTDPLPTNFPTINVLVSQPEKMEPGYTLFRGWRYLGNPSAYLIMLDNQGDVVWYSSSILNTLDVRQLDNGNLFITLTTNFTEVNLLGQTVNSWGVPTNRTINFHGGVPTDHGTILYFSDASRLVTNFPTSSTNPNAPLRTTNVDYQSVIEISATNSALLNTWSPIDMLDPRRISYLTFLVRTAWGWDWSHSNAIIEDPRDDSLIVSMRHQNAIIKFARATGQLKWILGPPENWGPAWQPYLLTPVGTPFQWNYGQHAPTITPQGTLLIFDNGDYRASPFATSLADSNNYSRAVEYSVNEQTMQVSQVWEYGRTNGQRLYADQVGNADWLPQTGNILIHYGCIQYVNGVRPSAYSTAATMVRIKEVTRAQPPEVVFDIALFDYTNTVASYRGYYAYRSHRVPDLYGHPARAVADLTVNFAEGLPHLQFSGDPIRTYIIQASTDLVQWTDIATAVPGTGGDYDFTDTESGTDANRYYRVATR